MLERRLGRSLEAAFRALVEVHRRAVQPEENSRRFDGRGLATDVIARERLEIELRHARALPQEVDIDFLCEAPRLCQQLARRRLLERKQHAARAHLAAPAMRALDLEGRWRLGEDRTCLELALLLVEHVHSVPRERKDAREMRREALQAVITALHHALLCAGIAAHSPTVVQHLVSGFHEQQIPLGAHFRHP